MAKVITVQKRNQPPDGGDTVIGRVDAMRLRERMQILEAATEDMRVMLSNLGLMDVEGSHAGTAPQTGRHDARARGLTDAQTWPARTTAGEGAYSQAQGNSATYRDLTMRSSATTPRPPGGNVKVHDPPTARTTSTHSSRVAGGPVSYRDALKAGRGGGAMEGNGEGGGDKEWVQVSAHRNPPPPPMQTRGEANRGDLGGWPYVKQARDRHIQFPLPKNLERSVQEAGATVSATVGTDLLCGANVVGDGWCFGYATWMAAGGSASRSNAEKLFKGLGNIAHAVLNEFGRDEDKWAKAMALREAPPRGSSSSVTLAELREEAETLAALGRGEYLRGRKYPGADACGVLYSMLLVGQEGGVPSVRVGVPAYGEQHVEAFFDPNFKGGPNPWNLRVRVDKRATTVLHADHWRVLLEREKLVDVWNNNRGALTARVDLTRRLEIASTLSGARQVLQCVLDSPAPVNPNKSQRSLRPLAFGMGAEWDARGFLSQEWENCCVRHSDLVIANVPENGAEMGMEHRHAQYLEERGEGVAKAFEDWVRGGARSAEASSITAAVNDLKGRCHIREMEHTIWKRRLLRAGNQGLLAKKEEEEKHAAETLRRLEGEGSGEEELKSTPSLPMEQSKETDADREVRQRNTLAANMARPEVQQRAAKYRAKMQAQQDAATAMEAEKRAMQEATEAEAKTQEEAQAKALVEAQAKARADAQAKALVEAQAKARAEAQAKAAAEAQAKARGEAHAKALAEAQAKARAEAQAKALAEVQAKARLEAQAKALEEEQAKARAEAQVKALAEAQLKTLAETQTKALAEAQAKAAAGGGRHHQRTHLLK